jgi:hypothetical protein
VSLEVVCGALALSTALLLVLSFIGITRAMFWRERYAELVAKPFSFWEAREHNRRMFDALGNIQLSAIAQPRELPEPDGKVLKFRRPPSFETKL